MKTVNLFGILAILLFVTVSVSAAASQTLVVGKIYDNVYGASGLGGVTMSISCNTGSWAGTGLATGDYGANFNSSDCKNGDIMTVTLSKTGYNTNVFTTGPISTISLGSNQLFVINFVMTTASGGTTGGNPTSGGSGRVTQPEEICIVEAWDCSAEWSECANDLQTKTCISNCATERVDSQSCVVEELVLEDEEAQTTGEDEAATGGFFSAITGAVIGGGAAGWGIVVVFVVLIGGSFGVVRMRMKKKSKK